MESESIRPRKVRFHPKPPNRRAEPAPQPKREVTDNAAVDNDTAVDDEMKEALCPQINARLTRSHTKAEKKSSVQVALGYGGDSSSSLRSFGKQTRGSKEEVGPNDPETLDLSAPVVVSDDIVESSENHSISSPKKSKKKEYKEPWDYEHSNYPITLPLRKPYSGDPEILDEEEFGAKATSLEYVEDVKNAASKLGLMTEYESDEKRMIFFQFPGKLPFPMQQTPNLPVAPSLSAGTSKSSIKPGSLEQLPAGHMGKMLVYKSGAVKLKMGDILFDVSPGVNCGFQQDVVAINNAEKHCSELGKIESRAAVVTPDVDFLLKKPNIKMHEK